MKRWMLLCGVILLFAGIASAQDFPKVEVFGGYSYLRANAFGAGFNFHGGSGSFSYNPNAWLGLVGDFGGYHYGNGGGGSANVVSYLFGPKLAFRRGPITPFAQALFGGAHGLGSSSFQEGTSPENAFAAAFGGGLDWNATPHIGVRLLQAEYLLTKFNGFGTNGGDTENNLRISVGVVLRF